MEAFRRRLRLIVFLVSGFPLALAAVAYTSYQYFERYQQEVRWLEHRAQHLSELVAPKLAQRDAHTVHERLSMFGLDGNLAMAQIYDANNLAIAGVAVDGRDARKQIHQPFDGADFQLTRLVYQQPISHGGNAIGRVVLDADLGPLYRGLLKTGFVGLLTITAAFLLAFSIASRFENRVVNRLSAVADAVNQGARNVDDQPPAAVLEEEEELGELARAVNSLVTRHAETNRRLRANQAYYLSLLNHVVDLIFVVDDEAKILFVNSATQSQLGYPYSSMVGQTLCHFVVPEEKGGQNKRMSDRIREIGASPAEWEFKHRDGSTRNYEVRASDQRDNPAVGGIVIGCHDVTVRELLEEEVVWKDQLLDVIFENIPTLVYLKDAKEQRYVRVNRAMEEFLDMKREDVVGKTDFDLFTASTAMRNRAADIETLAKHGVHEEKGVFFSGASGEERWVDKKAVGIIPDESGKPRYILVTGEEITTHERLQRKLQATEERYRQVVENAGEAFFLMDTQGRFLDVNGQACESLGYTRDELLALSMSDIAVNAGKGRANSPWWMDLSEERAETWSEEYRRKDGSRFSVEVRCSVWDDAEQRYVIALAREVGSKVTRTD